MRLTASTIISLIGPLSSECARPGTCWNGRRFTGIFTVRRAEHKDVLFDIDVAGVRQLSSIVREDMATVFLLPPSVSEQIARLKRRASDGNAAILKRLKTARDEIRHWADFDYILVNDDLDRAFMELRAILHAERLKQRRRPKIEALIAELGQDLDGILAAGALPV
ncbi:MAG: guanylate kinase [Xanthobacteraceae bacterium]|nr:MAG: guanylate kinase [Xanthobacteraceae bacterium]